MANKIQLDLVDITPSSSSNGAYVMALTEIAGARSLAIVIGPAEAHSIVIVMEKMPITRPLTHDLFVSLAENSCGRSFHLSDDRWHFLCAYYCERKWKNY